MIRLDARRGALGALVVGALYMGAGLATGHSARSEPPLDLMPGESESGLDVWKTAALLLEPGAVVVDVRPAEEFARYHLPRAQNLVGADVTRARTLAQGGTAVIVATRDDQARALVAGIRAASPQARAHYLLGGARAWYLAFELPVPLFNEGGAPSGYDAALATVRQALLAPASGERATAALALETLARLNVQPTLLKATGRGGAGGAGRARKIAGGCG